MPTSFASPAVTNPTISTTNNRLSSSGYTYDASGNLTADAGGQTYIYDAENKQIEVKNSSSVPIGQYWYDGDGRRIKKYVPGTGETTVFVYDASGKVAAEYSTILNPTPQVSYLTNDDLGTPRIDTNENGSVISRHDYHPFGEEIITAQRIETLGYRSDRIDNQFTGYKRDDEIDLDFAEARYYNFAHGRFTTSDPLMASAKSNDPQSWNRYIYCLNSPLTLIDPSGMDVQMLDEKATARVLSTLPKEIREKVGKAIGKDGLLKKGALDKIKSTDANFLDLKTMVNGKGVVEVMTASKDENGVEFFYESAATDKARTEKAFEEDVANGIITKEDAAEQKKAMTFRDNMYDGRTLTADQTPSRNIRVILADGTGKTAEEPASRLTVTTAHEFYGHAFLAQQGKSFKHDDGGPVDKRDKVVEQRTQRLINSEAKSVKPQVKKPN